MTRLWDLRWPGCQPLADQLRVSCAERWFRIHSLPESKRYAQTHEERTEVLLRHKAVLASLGAEEQTPVLTVTTEYSAQSDIEARLTGQDAVQPDAWKWLAVPGSDDADEPGWWQLYVAETPVSGLDGLLRLVADDGCRGVMLLPTDLSWIVHPYDGGADVFVQTAADRDSLRARFTDWLSAREDGL